MTDAARFNLKLGDQSFPLVSGQTYIVGSGLPNDHQQQFVVSENGESFLINTRAETTSSIKLILNRAPPDERDP